MSLLGSNTYTVTRRTSESVNVNTGLFETTTTTFSISATIRPATGNDLQLLEDAYRSEDVRKIITDNTSQGLQLEDLISISGNSYRVINVKDSSVHKFLEHYRAMAVKVKE